MASGDAIGCFALTEPDAGSDPAGLRTHARRDGSGERADWVLDGTKMWITNAPVSDVAVIWARTDDGIRGFVVPTDTAGFTAREVPGKLSLRASVTGEIALDGVRLPYDAVLPEVTGLRGPLSCLTEARYGIVCRAGRPSYPGDGERGKLDNVRTALGVARSMRTILGGSGITTDYSPLRHATNLETALTYEGTQEVHQLIVGQVLTGLDAFAG
jgi:glutaryl-CoA dehydrogenase